MPIYEYRCPSGHQFEIFQRMTDEPLEACEVCGEGPLAKVLHPVPVHFKGSGFYSTDYGRASQKKEASEEKAPAEGVKKVEKSETGGKSEQKAAEA